MSENLPEEASIGVDSWCVSVDTANRWVKSFAKKNQKLIPTTTDVVDQIWKNRPPSEMSPLVIHPLEFAGCSVSEKLEDLRGKLKQESARSLVIAALDEVAWLYNIQDSFLSDHVFSNWDDSIKALERCEQKVLPLAEEINIVSKCIASLAMKACVDDTIYKFLRDEFELTQRFASFDFKLKFVEGPQYVCTNFWTFVCITCSGIHREFTHRVKSVSMSKFTSQEVEVLQNGGNQRAREIYLKNWDHQRQRLPNNSNADRVREFIRNVYVEKKYAGANATDKPPKDSQNHGSSEDVSHMTQRANSYHSYSQSPPYDYQYEERRYGKTPLGFTGKSASVRGLHAKASSFAYSPGRFSAHMFEDQFSNEGSVPRASDFSISSGGDLFRSETQSPNFQQEVEVRSPQFQHSNGPPSENLFPDRQHQRTTSSGSVRSVDSNSMSIKSYISSGLGDSVPENGLNTGSQQDETSTPVPLVAESTKASIDLFQLPGAPMDQSVNTFQPSTGARSPPANFHQPPQTYSSTPTELFAGTLGPQPTSRPPDMSVPKNEGWASFDNPMPATKSTNVITSSSSGVPQLEVENEGIPQPSTSMQWPPYPSVVNPNTLSISSPWQDDHSDILENVVDNPPWNAFPDSMEANPLDSTRHIHQLADGASTSSYYTDQQHLDPQVVKELSNDGTQTDSGFGYPGNIVMAPVYSPFTVPEEPWQCVNDQKSANPFDLPYESEFDSNDMFMDTSSLQGTLPDIQAPPTFFNDASQPWLAADSQLQSSGAQGPVASTGGNPFA